MLGWKDSNLRINWLTASCLAAWLHPNKVVIGIGNKKLCNQYTKKIGKNLNTSKKNH